MNDSVASKLTGSQSPAVLSESPFDRPVKLRIACMNLRHKLMYVDVRHMHRGMTDDSSSTRVFWCSKTHNVLGPDDEAVAPDACSMGRACYCHGG